MYGRDKYHRIDSCEEEDWRRAIGSIDLNGKIKIDSKFPPEFTSTSDMQGALFPIEIRVDIEKFIFMTIQRKTLVRLSPSRGITQTSSSTPTTWITIT